jgi:acetyl-CoA carboxylase carboxyl transferase subunit alpha
MNVVDELVPEPAGGAHRDPQKAAEALGKVLKKHLSHLSPMKAEKLIADRYAKFRALGVFSGK